MRKRKGINVIDSPHYLSDHHWKPCDPLSLSIGAEIMRHLRSFVVVVLFASMPHFATAQTVIKKETLSFDGCLEVIKLTEAQIGMPPKLTVNTEKRRVAEFLAPDGTVIIECDRSAKEVTVSIK